MRDMKVRIDRDRCTGLANCVAIAPTVFEMDDEFKAVVIDESSVDDETLWRAARACTQDAVILQDDNGKQLYPEK